MCRDVAASNLFLGCFFYEEKGVRALVKSSCAEEDRLQQPWEIKSAGKQCLEEELCAGGQEKAVLILFFAYWRKISAVGVFCGCNNTL